MVIFGILNANWGNHINIEKAGHLQKLGNHINIEKAGHLQKLLHI